MYINRYLNEHNISLYKLANDSGVSYPEVYNIINGKKDIKKCAYYIVEKLANALNLDICNFVDMCNPRYHFQTFRSEQHHLIKMKGELQYLIDLLKDDKIQKTWDKHFQLEALYLLAMTDFITAKNGFDRCTKYDFLRQYKPDRYIYPADVGLEDAILGNDTSKERAIKNALPEFLAFNIVEGNIYE